MVQQRNHALDLIKWLAMISMTIDHLRFIFPSIDGLIIIGRLAFPLFCLAIAINVQRISIHSNRLIITKSYISKLLLFSIISELPYRLLHPNSETFNIMPTLLLGLLICLCAHEKTKASLGIMTVLVCLALLMDDLLMYGALGTLLPIGCLIVLSYKGLLIIPMLLSLLCNSSLQSFTTQPDWHTSLLMLVALLAPAIGILLLRQNITYKIYPVTQWGYWFYPLHLLVIYWLRTYLFQI